MNIVMPFSPLDAILDALPELRRAGKVQKTDNVFTVSQRMADVLTPIVNRIRTQAVQDYKASLVPVSKQGSSSQEEIDDANYSDYGAAMQG